jgi:hypothetical protein
MKTGCAPAMLLLSLSLLSATWPRTTLADAQFKHVNTSSTNASHTGRLEKHFGGLPAVFEANAGQAAARIMFLSRGARHTLMLGADGASLALRPGGDVGREGVGDMPTLRAQGESVLRGRAHASSLQLLSMKFVGANPRASVVGEDELKAKVNYFVGNDPSKWRAGIRTFARVRYKGLYPGVDLVYHEGDGGRLEYDFVLAVDADYRSIRLRFDGAEGLSVNERGELLVKTKTGTVKQSAPVVFQEAGGVRREVEASYVLQRGGREVGFKIGEHDESVPLVIDPVLIYSTYFPEAEKMAVDSAGGVYVVGTAQALWPFPSATPGAFQTTLRGDSDAFVAKLDASGNELSYLTYLGGSAGRPGTGVEYGQGIAVDASGSAYVTGLTYSPDFPIVNAFQPVSGEGGSEGFVSKLNPTGSALVYSSYLGGTKTEWSKSIAVDASGAAYVFGSTFSTDFPIKNALQPTKKGGDDYFVTKVAPSGSSLEYSTYLGGNGGETGYLGDIAVDSSGAAYVAGTTDSNDYPVTPGAYQQTLKSSSPYFTDIVVTKIAPGGASLVYSTYLGGTDTDFAYAIAVDAAGQAHVVGTTDSEDFPTLNALYPSSHGRQENGLLAKLNATGTALVYSTYLGGTQPRCGPRNLNDITICGGGESSTGVTTDAAGNAYVTGNTFSKDFPAPVNALQSSLSGYSDAYIIKLNPSGAAVYSTYLGGSSGDEGADIYADANGTIYLLGDTSSDDFPVVNPYRDLGGYLGGFVAKISDAAPSGQSSSVRFDSSSYVVDEGGRGVRVNVTRAGDLSHEVSVEYSTGDRTASERSDYTTARGTLHFAPGEAVKSFEVSVTNDNSVEGDETISLTLHNLRGPAVLAAPISAFVTVRDDDERTAASNPIDDTPFFVRQHYLDFLGREPDDSGLNFWTNEIEQCGANAQCREVKRINVSAAFFLSIEFQETGFLVERLYRLAFGLSVPYRSFVHDAREVGEGVVVGQGNWQQRLNVNRRAYAEEFAARAAFKETYPDSMSAARYVDLLNSNSGGSLSRSERDALVAALDSGAETRGSVLLKIADDEDFRRKEFSPAFVLMQYLGYLRRDPDFWPDNGDGYRFWLAKLNRFGGDWRAAELVRAFITSIEYRGRFHESAREATLGQPFTLKLGELIIVQPDKLRLSILDTGYDSRCPRGTTCATPGSVSVLFQAVKPGGETARFVLKIDGGVPRPYPSNTPADVLGYKFRLLQFDPEPPNNIQYTDYEALLQVDKD